MRLSSFIPAVSAFAFVAHVIAEGASDVLDLKADTFDSVVKPESLILVEFFAPWCGHCKALAPHYEEAATALKEKDIKIAKVDCVDQPELCQTHGVQGYPTLKVFRNGIPTDYTGPRKADGIISYMVKQSLPAVSQITAANVEEFQKADKIVVIVYLPSATAAPASEFSATAEKYRDDYLFGSTTDEEAISIAGVTAPAVVVYRSFDDFATPYPYPIGSATVNDFEEWLKGLSLPILGEVNGDNYAMYASSPKPLAYLFVDPTDEEHHLHIDAIKTVAVEHRDKLNFVWIDAIKFGDHAKSLNLQEAVWPSFVIQDMEKQLKYPFDQNIRVTPERVAEHVQLFQAGKLEPQLKSQPIPTTQDESVYNLVGKQFEEIVFDDTKDVFVEFYASWCGHCKRLKPTWDSLGDHFVNVKDRVVIAKMEAQENDLPLSLPFQVSGFPTLKFKQAGTKEFMDYDGDRSLESLILFVEENAKNSLEPKTHLPARNETKHEEVHDEL